MSNEYSISGRTSMPSTCTLVNRYPVIALFAAMVLRAINFGLTMGGAVSSGDPLLMKLLEVVHHVASIGFLILLLLHEPWSTQGNPWHVPTPTRRTPPV